MSNVIITLPLRLSKSILNFYVFSFKRKRNINYEENLDFMEIIPNIAQNQENNSTVKKSIIFCSSSRKSNNNRVGHPFQKNRHIFLDSVSLTEKT